MKDNYRKIRKRIGILLLLTGLFLFGSLQVQAATPYASNGKLSVKGSKIVNSKGKEFVIKGVSTHGLSWYPEYVNQAAFKTLRDEWGVNTIRLAMYTAEYNGYCTGNAQNQKNLKQLIDRGVSYATDLGMYVIIDWHILSDGNPLTYKKQANAFFKEVAKKYAKNGHVLYEICNEPNGSGGSWKNIKKYAASIIKTIRSVNADAIIIVGTPTWSQDVDTAAAGKITGYKNIAYSFHFYAGTHQASMRTKLEGALKQGLPVIVTEFGISDASGNGGVNKTEGNSWIRLLDQYKVGRVAWNLSNKNESSALLKASCSKKSGWKNSDLSTSGAWLKSSYTGKTVSTSTGKTTSSSAKKTTSSSAKKTTSASTKKTASTSTAKTTSAASAAKSGTKLKKSASKGNVKVTVSVSKVNSWKSGKTYYTQYKLVIKNTGTRTLSNWSAVIRFSQNVKFSNKWCGKFSVNKKKLTVKPLSWNQKLTKNGTAEIGFIVRSSKAQSLKALSVSAS